MKRILTDFYFCFIRVNPSHPCDPCSNNDKMIMSKIILSSNYFVYSEKVKNFA